jgi:ribosomal protein S27E
MVWLKSCQRCGGDLYEETDHFGSYVSCFQCGSSVVEPEAGTAFGDVVESLDMVDAQAKSA